MKRVKDFSQIQNELIKDNTISDAAFRTYMVLCTYNFGADTVWPSIKTIAQIRGKSRKTIMAHLKELEKYQWVVWQREGYSKTNHYYFAHEVRVTKRISDEVSKKAQETLQKDYPKHTKYEKYK